MKGLFVLIFTLACLSVFTDAEAQRYRNQNSLGNEEMVKFIALKNGDVLEFNWEIKSTRAIKSIELQKGHLNSDKIEWKTVKELTLEDVKYVDPMPDLGQVYYKLILTDESGNASEYDPEFKVIKDGTTLL